MSQTYIMSNRSLAKALRDEMWEEKMAKVTPYIIVSVMFVLFVGSAMVGAKKNEIKECLGWQTLEKTRSNFHPSELMNEQCNQYGIEFMP